MKYLMTWLIAYTKVSLLLKTQKKGKGVQYSYNMFHGLHHLKFAACWRTTLISVITKFHNHLKLSSSLL